MPRQPPIDPSQLPRRFLHPADPHSLQIRMKRLFGEGFSVVDIAEPLLSFGVEEDAREVGAIMDERNLSVAGLRLGGAVVGFAEREALTAGICGEHLQAILSTALLPETASLPAVIDVLDGSDYAFITLLGEVGAVVRREDVQKAPVRMWLFGMITIVEMYMVRRIEEYFPSESWRELLTPGRLAKAETLQGERRRRKESVRLLDCLQLSDKAGILLKHPEMLADFGFATKREGKRAVKDFEGLRNNLAHTQDIVSQNWDEIVAISRRLDTIMTRL